LLLKVAIQVPASSPPPAARVFLLLRALQPQAAKPAATNLWQTTEGGEES